MWYLPTHADLSSTCKFKIKNYPSWTKLYLSYSTYIQTHAASHHKSKKSKEGDKCHQIWNTNKHLNEAADDSDSNRSNDE